MALFAFRVFFVFRGYKSFPNVCRTCEFFKTSAAEKILPSHGSGKILPPGKNCSSSFVFEPVAASGRGGDIKTILAFGRLLFGSASSVSKTWFTTPSLFGATMTGIARNAKIKSRELKFSPRGLNRPPAPSTSKTSKRFCSGRRCARTCGSFTDLFSCRAASEGATGARKCHGLISSKVSGPSRAACKARASARPPEQTGLSAAARAPRARPPQHCAFVRLKSAAAT